MIGLCWELTACSAWNKEALEIQAFKMYPQCGGCFFFQSQKLLIKIKNP